MQLTFLFLFYALIKEKQQEIKVVEYTIFEDKFHKPEYTTFQDEGSNSLSHVKSELLVSYSKFPFKKWISW
jgi:hypothetical protein